MNMMEPKKLITLSSKASSYSKTKYHYTGCIMIFITINIIISLIHYTGRLNKKYPLLTGYWNEAIRYYYSPNGQLNLSNFNLASHNLHLKIVHQKPEIQACKVKIYRAPDTRGFEKGPSHDLYHGYFPKYLL